MSEDTKGQVENILAELGKKIDQLIHETKDASTEVRDDVEEKIKELKKKKEKLENDFHTYKDRNEDKWGETKTHLSAALREMKKAVDAIFRSKEA